MPLLFFLPPETAATFLLLTNGSVIWDVQVLHLSPYECICHPYEKDPVGLHWGYTPPLSQNVGIIPAPHLP